MTFSHKICRWGRPAEYGVVDGRPARQTRRALNLKLQHPTQAAPEGGQS